MPRFGPPKFSSFNRIKEKHSFSLSWAKLIKFCKKHIFSILLAMIFAVGGTVFTIIGPDKLKEMTNTILLGLKTGTMDLKLITTIALTLVAYYSISIILSYLQHFIMATVTQRVCNGIRKQISRKINRLPLKYFDGTNHGEVLSKVTNDVDTIGNALNNSIVSLVSAIVLFIGSTVMMFKTSYIMALVAIGASLIGFIFMALILSRSRKFYIQQQQSLGNINGHIEEVYSGHNVVKVFNAEKELTKDFNIINKRLYESSWKSQFMSGLMHPIMHFIGNFGYVAVCVVGAMLTINGNIEFGTIIAFMVYVRLFTQPLSTIAQNMTSMQSCSAASFRVFEFLEESELENESHKTKKLEDAKGEIEFKNVKFGYNKYKTIINNFSAKVKPGQKVAIVGPTGAGKTTMVNLLMRFYEIDDGEIIIDGKNTKDLTRENVHDLFCMVLQDSWLFEGTIRDNIVYNNKEITDEEVIKASKAVGLHHYVKTLPDGYNTILNEDASLSAGQKQLVTIARAMVDNAPMLILDEATSNVDTRTEILIQNAMDKLMQGRTSIIIAHRLSTIKNADLILVMKDGDIIESGNHEELLSQNGFYAELYNSQFEKIS